MLSKTIFFIRHNIAFFIGLVFVCAIAPITYHLDFYALSKMAERTAGGDLRLYSNLIVDGVDYGKFIMPPFAFLVDGLLFFIFKASGIISFDFGSDIPSFSQAFLLKSRYVLLFILSYPIMQQVALKLTGSVKSSRKIASLWIASPILLYLPFAQGNNDIYPTLFILIFLLFAFNKNFSWAMIFLGLAAATKNFALFLILPMAIILAQKNPIKTLKLSLISVGVYIIPMTFYYKDVKTFLIAGGEGLFIFNTKIPSDFNYLVFPILYIFLLLYLFFEEKVSDQKESIIFYGMLFMSLFFAISFFIPQWFLWTLPFLILTIYKDKKSYFIYLMLVVIFFLLLLTRLLLHIYISSIELIKAVKSV